MPFRFYQAVNFPESYAPKIDKWLLNYEICVGNFTGNLSNVNIESKRKNTEITLIGEFQKNIELKEDVDVKITSTMIVPANEPIQIIYARYPAQGFYASLTFDDDHDYDCAWFTFCVPECDIPSRGYIDPLPSGITASTNEWVLPGEGVALYHFKKVRAPILAEPEIETSKHTLFEKILSLTKRNKGAVL